MLLKDIENGFFLHKIKINGLYMDRNILKNIAGEFKSYKFGVKELNYAE